MKTSTPSRPAAARHPGAEPLPGYCLLKLLGRGGFGEVWQCEAPGRLHKAIKFVSGDDQFRTELAAFEHMRTIRHPYLMTLERVEALDGELVMVMELADGHINDRFRACVADGLGGIPRDELLGYLNEAAEALDFLSNRHGLQHLDVKPENLLLLAGHVKLGDYGLVRRADPVRAAEADQHGFTPRYTAPEVLTGRVDPRSDQYSLALVYVELLAGVFPFSGKTPQQLLLQHATAEPDLSTLSSNERNIVGRALAKDPERRFASSSVFIRALTDVVNQSSGVATARRGAPAIADPQPTGDTTRSNRVGPVSEYVGTRQPSAVCTGQQQKRERPVLDNVVSTDWLKGMPGHKVAAPPISMSRFVRTVVGVAARTSRGTGLDVPPDAIVRHFLSTVPAALIPLKLAMIAKSRNITLHHDQPDRAILRCESHSKFRLLGKPRISGYEIAVHFPTNSSAVSTMVGSHLGSPDRELIRQNEEQIDSIMNEIKKLLENRVERRVHTRFPFDAPILAYPYYTDGEIDAPIPGQCQDVSKGGLRFASTMSVRSDFIYVEFQGIEDVADLAVLLKVIRSGQDRGNKEFITVGQFSRD